MTGGTPKSPGGRARARAAAIGAPGFEPAAGRVLLENLRKAGVQSTGKPQHLHFDSLEPFAGEHIHL